MRKSLLQWRIIGQLQPPDVSQVSIEKFSGTAANNVTWTKDTLITVSMLDAVFSINTYYASKKLYLTPNQTN